VIDDGRRYRKRSGVFGDDWRGSNIKVGREFGMVGSSWVKKESIVWRWGWRWNEIILRGHHRSE